MIKCRIKGNKVTENWVQPWLQRSWEVVQAVNETWCDGFQTFRVVIHWKLHKDDTWIVENGKKGFVQLRKTFKILLNNSVPMYISDLLTYYNSTRALRSSGKGLLIMTKIKLKSRERIFNYWGPSLWNKLPFDLRPIITFSTFKAKPKTYLFSQHTDNRSLCCDGFFKVFYFLLSSFLYCFVHQSSM